MQSLDLALKNRGTEGDPLPCPFSLFDQEKIRFRRGQLSLIAAAPGGGKSTLAEYLLVHMRYPDGNGVPGLYMSADSDMMTVGANVLSGLMGIRLEEAERLIGIGDPDAFAVIRQQAGHIWWCFRPSPTLEDIGNEVAAYAHVFGEYPHVIVADNLMDINEPGEEYSRYNAIIPVLVELARETHSHLILLHHVTGEFQDGNIPIPRSGIKHKVSEKPRLVLTLFQPEQGMLGIRVVKNTGGPADTKGRRGLDVPWLPECGYFGLD